MIRFNKIARLDHEPRQPDTQARDTFPGPAVSLLLARASGFCNAAVFAILVCGCCFGRTAGSEQSGGVFSEAVQYAQQRTVKVYGAAIGLVSGYGTGIIVSPDGLIVTAQGIHLSTDRIRVTLHDGVMHNAKVLRVNPRFQLALLKIDAATPDYFALSETPQFYQGDWVLAVSNAFKVADGPEPLSVNLGIISLRTQLDLKRRTRDVSYDGDVLLIDAITSNPGAAGGAVVTADNRLAGMIGKIIESRSTNTRINYAIPADLLAQFVQGNLVDTEDPEPIAARKADLGIRLFLLGGRNAPAYIDRVLPDGPAGQAKLRPDDLIVSIDGQAVHDVGTYETIVDTLKPGDEVTLVVKRRNQLIAVQVTPRAEGRK